MRTVRRAALTGYGPKVPKVVRWSYAAQLEVVTPIRVTPSGQTRELSGWLAQVSGATPGRWNGVRSLTSFGRAPSISSWHNAARDFQRSAAQLRLAPQPEQKRAVCEETARPQFAQNEELMPTGDSCRVEPGAASCGRMTNL